MTAININISSILNQLLLQLSLSKLYNIVCLCTVVLYCDPPSVPYLCVCLWSLIGHPITPPHTWPVWRSWAFWATRSHGGTNPACRRAQLPLLSGHFSSVSWICTCQRLNGGAAYSSINAGCKYHEKQIWSGYTCIWPKWFYSFSDQLMVVMCQVAHNKHTWKHFLLLKSSWLKVFTSEYNLKKDLQISTERMTKILLMAGLTWQLG